MTDNRSGEDGYALVAAVASIAFFATVSLWMLALTQRATVAGGAEIEAAHAGAAADAGIALALHGLLVNPRPDNAMITGRPNTFNFDGARLEVRVTQERGKVPLNLLDGDQLTRLLVFAGLRGEALSVARDSYLDWTDDDDEPRAAGAEADYYRPRGIRTRNGGFVTIGELGRVRGFTPEIVARIAPVVTTDFGSGSFEPGAASPAAIRIMYQTGDAAVAEILRSREAAGDTTAFQFSDRANLVATPIGIAVVATYPSGAVRRRSCVVELTGAAQRPYVIRHCES